jgi:hypothetical protein
MQCNVGGAERAVRLMLGVAAVAAGLFIEMEDSWRIAFFVIGGLGLATAAFRYCPLNSAAGRNSCRSS